MSQIPAEQLAEIIAAVKGIFLLAGIATPIFAAGAAWMGVKGSVNGMRKESKDTNARVVAIEADLKTLVQSDSTQNARLSGIEATLEAHHGWIGRVERMADRRSEPRT